MNAPITGADGILDTLRAHGIDCIFASPIAVMAPLWEAMAQRRARGEPDAPRYVRCRHESLAVSLASGYYKATGRPQAVFLPTGLGVQHGAMALRSAFHDRTPMLVLSPDSLTYGDDPALDPGPEWPSLLVDLPGPARHAELCVKWAREAKTPADLVHELRRALYFCQTVPRGPTLLSVPFDLLLQRMEPDTAPPIEPAAVVASPQQLDAIAALLLSAENPLIVTEHAGRTAADAATLTALAELLGAPVFEFMLPAYHNMPRAHPLCMLGPAEPVLAQADVIAIAGANAGWHPPHTALRPDCRVIHLEEDPLRPRAPYWGYRTTHAVAGDLRGNLEGLVERIRARRGSAPAGRAERWHAYKAAARHAAHAAADQALAAARDAVPAAALFRALHEALPASSSVVDEIVAQAPQMLQFLFESKSFRQYRGWFGGLGTSLGTALGVKLARPQHPVVCIVGDGALHYNPVPAALGLAQEYALPILIVVCDNRAYVSQTWNVHKYFGGGTAVRSGNFIGDVIGPTPDYVKLAEAYGGTGERVRQADALPAALERALAALAAGRCVLLDVFVEP